MPGALRAPHRWVSLVVIPLLACGGAQSTDTSPAPVAAAPEEPVAPPPPAVRGAIARADLEIVLDAGLGRFLQGVGTEPHLDDGQFVGFRLTRLYPADPRFENIDLRPGDTVLRVNGQSIERPEQALQVWHGLRVASELMIAYLRDGEPRELRFAIVD